MLSLLGDVFLYDYPGYGESGGEPGVESLAQAADAVGDYVRERFSDRHRVYWGYSVGGFSCARMAMADPGAKLLVLEAPTRSIETAVERFIRPPVSWFVRPQIAEPLQRYDLVDILKGAEFPVLVLSGDRDRIIPPRYGKALADSLLQSGGQVAYIQIEDANHFSVKAQSDVQLGVFEALFDLGLIPKDSMIRFAVSLDSPPKSGR